MENVSLRQSNSVDISQSKKKMVRRTQRGEVLVAPEIPLDLQIEIVNRLPINSLARFKCVSKLWFSVICSKGYLFPSPPRLYIFFSENPDKSVLLSLVSTCSKSSTSFDQDSTIDGIGGYGMVALRGLILYKTDWRQVYIYNPTTRQRVTLPAIFAEEEYIEHCCYFFGYDPVLDQYKVVCTAVGELSKIDTRYWVFVLEARSSWKRIEFNQPHIPSSKGFCINGIIYYLGYSSVHGYNVISFDVRSEEFNMIQVSSVLYEYMNSYYLDLIEYDGKPTIFDNRHLWDPSGLLNLWVLEEAGKWSNKSLVLQSSQRPFFPRNIYCKVIGTTQNGEVVLTPLRMSNPYYILYYNLHTNYARRVYIKGISEIPLHLALMDMGESIMHLKI